MRKVLAPLPAPMCPGIPPIFFVVQSPNRVQLGVNTHEPLPYPGRPPPREVPPSFPPPFPPSPLPLTPPLVCFASLCTGSHRRTENCVITFFSCLLLEVLKRATADPQGWPKTQRILRLRQNLSLTLAREVSVKCQVWQLSLRCRVLDSLDSQRAPPPRSTRHPPHTHHAQHGHETQKKGAGPAEPSIIPTSSPEDRRSS